MFARKIIFFLFILCSKVALSQSIFYYPFNSLLGFNTNSEKKLWLDAKLQTNSYFSSLGTEIAPQINLNNNDKIKFFLGAGFKLNYLNLANNAKVLDGYFLNSGFRASPFEKHKKIQIAFEISPYVNNKFDLGLFRSHLGIGYNFSK
jgi:hypothetical protein